MALFMAIAGLLVLGVPIAYTFLRLADKIGPEDLGCAVWLGVFLWLFCGGISSEFISDAMKLSGH